MLGFNLATRVQNTLRGTHVSSTLNALNAGKGDEKRRGGTIRANLLDLW